MLYSTHTIQPIASVDYASRSQKEAKIIGATTSGKAREGKEQARYRDL